MIMDCKACGNAIPGPGAFDDPPRDGLCPDCRSDTRWTECVRAVEMLLVLHPLPLVLRAISAEVDSMASVASGEGREPDAAKFSRLAIDAYALSEDAE